MQRLDYIARRLQLKKDLKIPQATSPDGKLRLWFKSQAVWFTYDSSFKPRHEFKDARTVSYSLDIRKMTPEEFVVYLKKLEADGLLR